MANKKQDGKNFDDSLIDEDIPSSDIDDIGSSDSMHKNADGGMKDLMSKDKKGKDSKPKKGTDTGTDNIDRDGKDLNKTTAQKLAKTKATADTAIAGVKVGMMLNLINFMKIMAAKALATVQAIGSAIWGSIVTFVGNVAAAIGVAATTAAVFVSSIAIVVVSVTVVGVSTIVANISVRNDAVNSVCVPTNTTYERTDLEQVTDGEASQIKMESAQKVYNVFSRAGSSDAVIAGVLGNFDIESGLNPKTAEGHYLNPPVGAYDGSWDDDAWLDINGMAIYGRYPNILKRGLGLGQWTDTADGATGNSQLRAFAKKMGKPWYSIDAQLAFMFNEPDGQKARAIKYLTTGEGRNYDVAEATNHFLIYWEGNPNNKYQQRLTSAIQWLIRIKEMKVDEDYADSILNDANITVGDLNNAKGEYHESDGCDGEVGDHQSEGAVDGTGTIPSDLGSARAWTRSSLPESLYQFAHDPESVGLVYGGPTNWFEHSGQCVDFSNSYMSVLYSISKLTIGNGKDTAYRWADEYGGTVSKTPSAGAVFSCSNTVGPYGHTGIVEHVFANGDMLVIEQNVKGYSGHDNGAPDTWNWRIISKAEWSREEPAANNSYSAYKWRFFKPDETPKWENMK